jgi:hypothetical protein
MLTLQQKCHMGRSCVLKLFYIITFISGEVKQEDKFPFCFYYYENMTLRF